MTPKEFFTGRVIVILVLIITLFAVLLLKKAVPESIDAPVPLSSSEVQTGGDMATGFAWKFEKSAELNLDGIAKTIVSVDTTYANGATVRTAVDTVSSSCNEVDGVDEDSVAGTKNIQCYGAGLGYRYKITKGDTSYLVQRQMFEEGTPTKAAPAQSYEVVARIPFTQ